MELFLERSEKYRTVQRLYALTSTESQCTLNTKSYSNKGRLKTLSKNQIKR